MAVLSSHHLQATPSSPHSDLEASHKQAMINNTTSLSPPSPPSASAPSSSAPCTAIPPASQNNPPLAAGSSSSSPSPSRQSSSLSRQVWSPSTSSPTSPSRRARSRPEVPRIPPRCPTSSTFAPWQSWPFRPLARSHCPGFSPCWTCPRLSSAPCTMISRQIYTPSELHGGTGPVFGTSFWDPRGGRQRDWPQSCHYSSVASWAVRRTNPRPAWLGHCGWPRL